MSKFHELKTDPDPFCASMRGDKDFEIRNDDRGFECCDYVVLRETEFPGRGMRNGNPLRYTGRILTRRIKHIQRGYGLPDGVVVLGLEKV